MMKNFGNLLRKSLLLLSSEIYKNVFVIAVTQVEMEDGFDTGSSRTRRPKSRPKSRTKSRPKSRTTSRPRQRRPNDAFGGSLLPPVQNEANNEVNSRSRGRPQRLRDEARLKEAQRQK